MMGDPNDGVVREGPTWAMWTRVNGNAVFATFPVDPRRLYLESTWKQMQQTAIGDPFELAADERGMTIDGMIAQHPLPGSIPHGAEALRFWL